MLIYTIVGTRPQFIKAALLSPLIRQKHTEYFVHTGQHYDNNMSSMFFRQLGIPDPDENLNIGSGTHAEQTGRMLISLEKSIIKKMPDLVLLYGDTNSTLAGALASAKLGIPIAHIEAGMRSYKKDMPEEINRILSDHVSSLCLCSCMQALENLKKEGIKTGVYFVGDIMFDLLQAWQTGKFPSFINENWESDYWIMTLHRAANTKDPNNIKGLFNTLEKASVCIYWVIHPRSREFLNIHKLIPPKNLHLVSPLGYSEMMTRLKSAKGILTDSGGLQKEAFWLGVPCLTLREETEWTETVEMGANQLVGLNRELILQGLEKTWQMPSEKEQPYGNGDASQKMIEIINNYLKL